MQTSMASISPQSSLESGLKMVESAYQTQVSLLTSEINQLGIELQEKNSKIEELEVFSQQLAKDNKRLQQEVDRLIEDNKRLKLSNGIGIPHKPMMMINNDNNTNLANNLSRTNTVRKNYILNHGGNNNNISIDPLNNTPKPVTELKYGLTFLKQNDYSARNIKTSRLIAAPSEKSLANTSTSQISSDFVKKAKSTLMHNEYSQLMEIIKMSNSKLITKQETFKRISVLLESKYNDLYSDFKEIFN